MCFGQKFLMQERENGFVELAYRIRVPITFTYTYVCTYMYYITYLCTIVRAQMYGGPLLILKLIEH